MIDYKKIIGANVRVGRKSLRLTQEELGVIMGVGHRAISSWEVGRAVPSAVQLYRLSVLFDKSLISFYVPVEGHT